MREKQISISRPVLTVLIFLLTSVVGFICNCRRRQADGTTGADNYFLIIFRQRNEYQRRDLPAGSQAVLTIRGKRIDEEMMRKSRHWDLWMNSGEVDIDNAPLLYIASSSDPALLVR